MTTTTMTTMTTMKTSVKMPMTSDQCGAAHLHVARIAALMMLAGIAIGSPSSRAQVAVAVTFPDQNPTHRDLAAGIVEQLGKHWDFLAPPLAADDLALCRADVACLRPLASSHGASHLLLIGIAGLDAREAAVTARVIGPTGQSLFEETVVVVGSAAPPRRRRPARRPHDPRGQGCAADQAAPTTSRPGCAHVDEHSPWQCARGRRRRRCRQQRGRRHLGRG